MDFYIKSIQFMRFCQTLKCHLLKSFFFRKSINLKLILCFQLNNGNGKRKTSFFIEKKMWFKGIDLRERTLLSILYLKKFIISHKIKTKILEILLVKINQYRKSQTNYKILRWVDFLVEIWSRIFQALNTAKDCCSFNSSEFIFSDL